MRPEGVNPLDLNNLPDEYRDGKQGLEDTSSSGAGGYRKKKSGGKDGKDECGKVYECRFCSLKFCKSQALGGHMNRHRQERETETLNRARQLVFSNDNLAAAAAASGATHLGCCQPIGPPGGYHPSNMGDPTLPLRFPRYFSPAGSSSAHLPPPPPPPPPPAQPSHQPYLYPSPSRPMSFPNSHYPVNDYYVGHVLSTSQTQPFGHAHPNLGYESNYTCIGAPVGQGFPLGGGGGRPGSDGGRDGSEEGLNWGRSYSGGQQRLDAPPPTTNRFQDGF